MTLLLPFTLLKPKESIAVCPGSHPNASGQHTGLTSRKLSICSLPSDEVSVLPASVLKHVKVSLTSALGGRCAALWIEESSGFDNYLFLCSCRA